MSIARKSLTDYFGQNAALVISFVSGILVSMTFGTAGRGEYALVLTANLLLINMTNMGIEVSTRVFAGKRPKEVARIHTAGVMMIFVICIVVGTALLFFMDLVRGEFFPDIPERLLWLAAFLLPFSLYQLVWQGVMVGLGEIGWYARIYLWNRLIQSGAIIVYIAFAAHPSVSWLLYLWVIVHITFVMISIIIMAKKYRLFATITLDLIKKMLGFSWLVYAGNFAASLLHKFDMLMISRYVGESGAGIYNQAATFSDKVLIISGSLERATYNPATHADPKYAPVLIQKVFRYNLYVNLIGALGMYLFGSAVIRLLLPPEFTESLFPLKFLLLSVIFMSCSRILAIYFTAHLGKPQIPGIINWTVLPLSIGIVYYLAKNYGLRGACIGTATVYGLHAFFFFGLFYKRNRQLGLSLFFVPNREDFQYMLKKSKSFLNRILKKRK